MLKRMQTHWKRAVSGLLAVVMAAGMLPASAFTVDPGGAVTTGTTPIYAPTGDFELNVAGATAWNGGDQALIVYKAESGSAINATIPDAVPFALLEDNGGGRIKIGYVEDGPWTGSTLDATGWADKENILVNLPDVIPSIAYDRDAEKQFNSRLTRHEYVIAGPYALAEQLAQLQKSAMSGGDTLVVRQSGRTVSVSRAKGDPAQLHSYSLDGAAYQKYGAWTEYEAQDDSLSGLSYELPYSINRAYSADPSVTLTMFCPQAVRHAPAVMSASDPTGGVGAYNPGSPGGSKPHTSDVSWSTDPERTFLRFTLLEFPQGVVTDLNTNDWGTWHVAGTPLNVVWSKSGSDTWSVDKCRSDITWYNSNAMQYNAKGADAAQLMEGTVYSYDAVRNPQWVTTADAFQAATGISDQEKEQMFHLNSSSWTSGWRDGDYTSMWGTDAESVTPGNLYKVYKANDAFIYLLRQLSTQANGATWSEENAVKNWSEYVYDADGNPRTKYRIIVETGGIFKDPDGYRRAMTLREMMAYSLYNNEGTADRYTLAYDQASTIRNMSRWMRQGKDNQFLEYPLDENGTPTGEELHSTNGFRECDSFVDTIQYVRAIRDTIFAERRSFGLHIFSPFNFESDQPDRPFLEVTKKVGSGVSASGEWGFTVKYTAGSPAGFTAMKNGADCTSQVTETGDGLKFSLKADETIHIDFDSDASFRCEVTEDDSSNLTGITGTGGTAGTAKFTSTSSIARVTFTNGITDSGKKTVYLKLKKIAAADKRALSGAVFSVYADAACSGAALATMTTGSDGTATASVPNIVDAGGSVTLYVKETRAPAGCTPLTTPFTVTCSDPANTTPAGAAQVGPAAGIENGSTTTIPGDAILFKRDANTNTGVGPATFKFSSVVNGSYEFDTDRTGTLETIQWWDPTGAAGKYIKPGEYAVSEIIPPPNYMPTTEVKQIRLELDADGNPIPAGPLVFKNLAKVGLRIVKYDRLTHQPMNGVTFEIYKDGVSIGRYETRGNGEILLTDIEPGTYRAVEVDTGDEGHIMDGSYQEIELVAGEGTKDLIFFNDVKPGLKLVKVDSSDPSRTISGAKFSIRAVAGNYGPQEFITNGNGEIDLSMLPEGSYEVTEIECAGYVIDDAQRVIHLKANDTAEFVFTNTKKPGFRLVKTGADGAPLDGVTFKITPIEDAAHSIDRTTQNGGEIFVDGLEPGIYSVVETATLPEYVLDTTEYHVELSPGRTAELRLSNVKRPYLTIAKVEKGSNTPLPGTVFTIEGIDSDYRQDVTTGPNGTVTIQVDPGSYRVTEKSVPEPYVISDDPTQTISLNGGDEKQLIFENLKKPLLTISKIDADTGEVIPGTVFTVRAINGDYQDDWTTGPDGKVSQRVAPGVYQITEKSVPAPYFLPDQDAGRVQTISLNAGDEKTVLFKNHKAPELTIYKEDSVAGAPIEGAKFHVTYTSNGEAAGAPASFDFGYLFTDTSGEIRLHEQGQKLYPGEYTITEVEPAPGFQMREPTTQTVIIHGGETKTVVFQNEPLNGIIVEKYDSVTHEALPGCTFQLRFLGGTSGTGGTVIGQKVTGKNGTCIWTGLTAGTYIVEEVDPADGYSIIQASETVYISDDGKQTVITVRFDNAPDGMLLIRKVCAVNPGVTLQDAEFKITYADGALIGDSNGIYVTDENGEIRITGLKPGKSVIVTETRAPAGFLIDTQSQTIQIKEGRTVSLTFKNQPMGQLIVQKRDSATGQPLPGAEFRITTASGCEVGLDGVIGTSTLTQNGIFTTDNNGEIRISNLVPGAYVITEIKAPDGYVMDAPSTNVVIGSSGDTQTVTITNTKKGSLLIVKKDAVTGEPLSGVQFFVTDSSGNVIGNSNGYYVTDSAGTILIDELDPGITLVVRESRAKTGYVLDDTPQTVKIKANETVSLEFRNQPQGALIINKRDSVTGAPLEGVEFKVTTASGEVVDNKGGQISSNGVYYTNAEGQIVISPLAPGTYVITETATIPGYLIHEATRSQTVVVNTNDTQTVYFYNDPTTTLVIHKYVEGTANEPLAGVAFKVVDGNGGAVGPDDGIYYTDKSGDIILTGLEPGMTVVAREIKTLDGFVLDGTPQDIQIKGGIVQQLTFWNRKAGTLVIQKKDSVSGALIAGAQFQLTYANGGYVDNDNGHLSSNGLYVTDANGEIRISGITGTVVAKEVQPAPGYVIDQATQTQTVTVNPMDTQTLVFLNEPLCSLTLTKLDSVTGKPVPNTEFTVKDSNGNVVGRYTTGSDGSVVVTGLIPGATYVVYESRVPDGYVLNQMPQYITVSNGTGNSWTSGGAGGGSGSGGGNGLVFENDPTTTLIIEKYITGTTTPLKGVTFLVTDSSGAVVGSSNGEYMTDENGRVVIENLEPGVTVTAREIRTVEGYILDSTPKTIKIKAGGAQTLTFYNAPFSGILIHKTDSVTGKGIYGVTFLLYDSTMTPIGQYTSDDQGFVHIGNLTQDGRYYLRELENEGYLVDTQYKTVYVRAGETTLVEWENTPITGQIQITKTSEDYNSVNGWPAGTPLPDVIFEIYDKAGNLVDTIQTDKNGAARSRALPLGRYTVKETIAAPYYALDATPVDVELEFSGQIVRIAMTNRSLNTNVSIKKSGYVEVMPGQSIRYDFSGIGNNSNVSLTSFYWRDTLPVDAVRLSKIVTGTYNAPGNYKIVYQTNLSNGSWYILADNLSTSRNYVLDASPAALRLAANEYVTQFMVSFGVVPANFRQVEAPQVYCAVLSSLAGGAQFVNQADAGGVYQGQWIMAASRWVTRVYKPSQSLPRTGY